MNISDSKLEKFVHQMQEAYAKESFVHEYVDWRPFQPEQDSDREYVQIGKRSNLPKRFFSDEQIATNEILGFDFAKVISRGEKRHILSTIKQRANSGQISQVATNEFNFDTLIQAFGEVYEPDYLFLPNEANYRTALVNWRKDGRITNSRMNVEIAQSEVEIEWVPSKLELDGGYLFNSDSVNIVQKTYSDIDKPDDADFRPDRDWCSENDFLMAYFGDAFEGDQSEFDFWIRTILSKPVFERGGVCHLKFNE
ncbi:hypothetical protein DM826_03935 [Halonotius aquaticus]|uniref:Uncharacterized protein n=1 Tax=Halonotius aquaticus TaxID=2216978 RepID=A0A3A6PRC6_9EURY|nr:hypothetical protein [Halonotius aquaticus]RJX44233.1 hypothetical protein DM826_03935 [Halonotius aquaticus]